MRHVLSRRFILPGFFLCASNASSSSTSLLCCMPNACLCTAGSMPGDMESRARRHGRIPPDIAAQFDAVPGADDGLQSEQQGRGQGAPKLNVQG